MNRRIVTGKGHQGRSSVLTAVDLAPVRIQVSDDLSPVKDLNITNGSSHEGATGAGEVHIYRHLVVDGWPTAELFTGGSGVRGFELHPGHGSIQWQVVHYGPQVHTAMHTTETVDLQYVARGRMDLILDESVIELLEGDAVIVPGVAHAWRTHDEPCIRVSVIFGLPPALDGAGETSDDRSQHS